MVARLGKIGDFLRQRAGWGLLALSLAVAGLCLLDALGRFEKPFSGFFYGPNLVVSVAQRQGWPGPEAGLKSMDHILAVAGRPLARVEELQRVVAACREGQPLEYSVERQGRLFSVTVPVKLFSRKDLLITFLAPFFIGLLFLGNGAAVYAARRKDHVTWLFFLLCLSVGLFYITLFEANTGYRFFLINLVYPIFGPLAMHLFLHFPRRFTNPALRAPLLAVTYGGGLLLILFRYLFRGDAAISARLSHLASLYMGVAFVCIVGVLAGLLWRERRAALRRRLKVVLPAVFLGSLAGLMWAFRFVAQHRPFYLDQALALSSLFPLLMSYAILKENLFDIDSVIRRGLVYGLSSAMLFGFYLLLVMLFGWVKPSNLASLENPALTLAALLLLILLFHPLRQSLQDLAYRLFFHSQSEYVKRLESFGTKLATGMSLEGLSRLLVDEVCLTLGAEGAALYVGDKIKRGPFTLRRYFHCSPHPPEQWLPAEDLQRRFVEERDLLQPEAGGERDRAECLRPLQQAGLKMVLPLVSGGQLLGVLALGGKAREQLYTEEDLNFLRTVATQGSIALENALLYEEVAANERLAALGRLSSVIVHEVKNPLGVIKVSSGTIRRLANDENIRRLSTFIEEEVERMNETILKILSFARPRETVLTKVDVNELAKEVARRYEGALQQQGVQLAVAVGSEPVFLQVDREKLSRAVANLLLNAGQAMPQGGNVTLEVAADYSGGWVEIRVADRGQGIPEELQEKIFQPFFTTRADGCGLGLALVKQVVQEHGGKLGLQSRWGEGSTFSLRFPLSGDGRR